MAKASSLFEQKIRPGPSSSVTVATQSQPAMRRSWQGALYLDTAAGIAAGGESGPTLIKGKSAESLLLKVLKHDGFLERLPAAKSSPTKSSQTSPTGVSTPRY